MGFGRNPHQRGVGVYLLGDVQTGSYRRISQIKWAKKSISSKLRGTKMDWIVKACQLIVGLGLLNVWLLRRDKLTQWRGGNSANMREEFAVYGLSPGFMKLIGFLKVILGLWLIVGLWLPSITRPAAIAISFLMVGAVAMHVKVKDPLASSLPALSLLILAIIVAIF